VEWGEFLGRPKPVDEIPLSSSSETGLDPIIRLKNLDIGYTKSLVSNITTQIYSGDRIAIIGPSGVGKTTLLRTIAGLIAPVSGEIENTFSARGEIGYIPQKLGLVRHSSARNNIQLGARTRKSRFYPPFIGLGDSLNNEVESLIQNLGIEDIADEPVRILSGGQQRRVAIARALIQKPGLIVADEFLGELDLDNIESIIEMLRLQLTNLNATLVMVEHQEDIARSIATRIWRIDGNSLVEEVVE
jgi:ABC-type phosphate/phosphonate transport system ATPase subunit